MKAEYIDHMGSDLTVVNSARVSFNKESKWQDTSIDNYASPVFAKPNRLATKDEGLIRYLAAHNHWTPFSHVIIQMRETIPLFVARQRFKHFVGFNVSPTQDDSEGLGMSYNEVSRRYVSDDPEFFIPDKWRLAAENKKQGSSNETITTILDELGEPYSIDTAVVELYEHVETLYKDMIRDNVAPEQARMILPQSMYTSYYVTGSLASWARAYKLRNDEHAQFEIRELAKQWDEVLSNIEDISYSWSVLKNGEKGS